MTSEPQTTRGGRGLTRYSGARDDSLADVLERVLDRGVVVAGDIVIQVLDIELLTLKVRLIIASADTAARMGIDWWKRDSFLTGEGDLADENRRLRARIEALEEHMGEGGRAAEEVGSRPDGDTRTAGEVESGPDQVESGPDQVESGRGGAESGGIATGVAQAETGPAERT